MRTQIWTTLPLVLFALFTADAHADCVSLSRQEAGDPAKICFTDESATLTFRDGREPETFPVEYRKDIVSFRGAPLTWIFHIWSGSSADYDFDAERKELGTSTDRTLSLQNRTTGKFQFGKYPDRVRRPPYHDPHSGGFGRSH